MDGAPAVGDLLAQFLGEFGVKPDQHLVDDVQGILGGGEFIGVRVQIALQPVVVAQGQVLEEGEGVVVVGCLLLQLGCVRHHALFLQQSEDLIDGVALRDGDLDGGLGGRVGAHAGDQGPVVHVGVQGEGPGYDLVPAAGEGGKELEEALVLDQAVFLQHGDHVAEAVLLPDGNRGRLFRLVQGQYIVGRHPADAGQQGGDPDNKDHIEQGEAGPAVPAAGRSRTGLSGAGPGGGAPPPLRLVGRSAVFLCHRVSS